MAVKTERERERERERSTQADRRTGRLGRRRLKNENSSRQEPSVVASTSTPSVVIIALARLQLYRTPVRPALLAVPRWSTTGGLYSGVEPTCPSWECRALQHWWRMSLLIPRRRRSAVKRRFRCDQTAGQRYATGDISLGCSGSDISGDIKQTARVLKL